VSGDVDIPAALLLASERSPSSARSAGTFFVWEKGTIAAFHQSAYLCAFRSSFVGVSG
jgi:hypothetical protein